MAAGFTDHAGPVIVGMRVVMRMVMVVEVSVMVAGVIVPVLMQSVAVGAIRL